MAFGTPSAREKEFSQYPCSRWSEIYPTDASINGLLNVLPVSFSFFFFFLNNFLKTFISLMKHKKNNTEMQSLFTFLSRRIPGVVLIVSRS